MIQMESTHALELHTCPVIIDLLREKEELMHVH